jgi:hypothetical protein
MPIHSDMPGTHSPDGITEEPDWQTLLDYTGEVTEEVIQSWWADVPVSSWPAVSERLQRLDAEDPKLAALIRRVTGL